MRLISAWAAPRLRVLLACSTIPLLACRGETVYLGDDPDAEDERDAGEPPDAEPCRERSDCDSDARPYCNPESRRCVECLADWQCEWGYCRNRAWAGECVGLQ